MAAAEGLDCLPTQVPPPAADGVPRRAAPAAGQQGKAEVLQFIEMEQALDAADQMLYVAKREGRHRARVDPDALRVAAGMAPVPRTGTQDQLGFPLV